MENFETILKTILRDKKFEVTYNEKIDEDSMFRLELTVKNNVGKYWHTFYAKSFDDCYRLALHNIVEQGLIMICQYNNE